MEAVRFRVSSSCGLSSGLLPPSDISSGLVSVPPWVRLGGLRWSSRSRGVRIHGSRLRIPVASRDEVESVSSTSDSQDGESEAEPIASSSSSAFQLAASVASVVDAEKEASQRKMLEKAKRRKAQRSVYLWAAIASSVGFSTLAAGAVYYRFVWQMQGSGEVPFLEVFGTFALAVGAAVGMEFWARWAHKALWHASLWSMHESHHRPREGPFELNDVFAIVNAVPAIALLAYGFFNGGLVPGLCFGAGLGITMFGIAYMFIHDGLVHRRFPVGPIADVPYLQKVAAAHQLHHADLFQGVPYGLFLGPKELEDVGGLAELEALMQSKRKASKLSKPTPS